MEKKPTKDQLKKISVASRKLADATDFIYDDELWDKVVRLTGEVNRYVNKWKRG